MIWIYTLCDWDGNCFGQFTKKEHAEIVKAEYEKMGLELQYDDTFAYSNKKDLKIKLQQMKEDEKVYGNRWRGGEE